MFEIGLIITLLVSISGMINGVSGQFVALLAPTQGNSSSYLMMQKDTTLETSKIPVTVIDALDTTYFVYYTPMIYKTVLDSSNQSLSYVYANYTMLEKYKSDFLLKTGSMPINPDEILIGTGLQQQLFQNIVLPYPIELQIGGLNVTKVITGIFSDTSFYDYAFLDNINNVWSNITTVSLFQFQIKNDKVFPVFQSKVDSIVKKVDPGLKLDISRINKSDQLANSFYIDIYNLFNYLQIIMILLLALKIAHSSYTLYNRYYKDFLILRILGTSGLQLQLDFYLILVIIGNLGILYGLIAGITLPQIFLFIIRAFVQYQGLVLVIPKISDIINIFVITNIFFILNSFWVLKLQVKDKLVSQN